MTSIRKIRLRAKRQRKARAVNTVLRSIRWRLVLCSLNRMFEEALRRQGQLWDAISKSIAEAHRKALEEAEQ